MGKNIRAKDLRKASQQVQCAGCKHTMNYSNSTTYNGANIHSNQDGQPRETCVAKYEMHVRREGSQQSYVGRK